MSPQSKFRLTALAGALALALSGEAAAQTTLTVNNNADTFTAGTLRSALNTVVNDCGCFGAPYTINFAFPGLTTIPVNSSLPVAPFPPACTVNIDGYSQPGSVPNSIAAIQSGTNAQPQIILNGAGMTGGTGLVLDGAGSAVRGLVFQNFPGAAVALRGANSTAIGNFFGVNATATACASSQPNMVGVTIEGGATAANVGGAPNPAFRNVFGCMSRGIDVLGSDAGILNNLIGTGAGGVALPNGIGIAVLSAGFSPGIDIGTPVAGAGNLISRNTNAGVAVGTNRNSVFVQGNDIFLNGGLGIDLGNNGPTPNNTSLFPTGAPNGGMNYPMIDFVRYTATDTIIDWDYCCFSNTTVSVDFYGNPPGLGLDEGARYFGSFPGGFTSGAGILAGQSTFPGQQPRPTAIANSASGSSEFSQPASIDVTPKNLAFTALVGSSSAPQTVTFTNISGAPLTIGPPVTVGDYSALAFGCDGVVQIPAGGSCTVDVTFNPILAGASTDFLDVVTSGTGGGRGIELAGNATPTNPVLAATPPGPINFGTIQVGSPSSPVTITYSNSGTGSLTVSGATLAGTNPGSFQVVSDGCSGQTLTAVPATTCDIAVAMNPQAGGPLAASLEVASNATNPVVAVGLSGTGSVGPPPVPQIVVTPAGPVDFGSRRIGTQSPATTFTLTTSGAGTATVSDASIRGTGFVKVSDTCTGNLLGGNVPSCTIAIAFLPTLTGTYRTSLQILSNASNPQVVVEITGTGTPLPAGVLTANPTSVSFGTQAIGVPVNPQTVEITNTGNLPASVSSVQTLGSDFAQTNDCGSLDVGQGCRVFVTFTPSAEGDRSGNLVVESNAANSPLVVSLLGAGSPAPIPVVELNPGAVSFGTSLMGSGGSGTAMTLRNAGGANLALAGIYSLGDFRVAHACPANLPPGASCTLTVSFAPSISGPRTGKVVVESNAPAGTKEATLSGTGCRNFGRGTARLAAPLCK